MIEDFDENRGEPLAARKSVNLRNRGLRRAELGIDGALARDGLIPRVP